MLVFKMYYYYFLTVYFKSTEPALYDKRPQVEKISPTFAVEPKRYHHPTAAPRVKMLRLVVLDAQRPLRPSEHCKKYLLFTESH